MSFSMRVPRQFSFRHLGTVAVVLSLFLGVQSQGLASTYQQYSNASMTALLRDFYHVGYWRQCASGCSFSNHDWGADSLTNTLFFHWKATHDPTVLPYFEKLVETMPLYGPCPAAKCREWSDGREWDSVAASRAFEATRLVVALKKAQASYESVESSTAYALGACPSIRFQKPFGAGGGLKTLETEANAIKASLLLYRYTGSHRYLTASIRRYAAVRKYFLDPQLPLYSVYVFDNGSTCTQLPHRFFASVNGLMVSNGTVLTAITKDPTYRRQAIQTAYAVKKYLSDSANIYENLQAENDIEEPLVEALYDLAKAGDSSIKNWLLSNADAAISDRETNGTFGRFFGGPPPAATISEWQTNGGFALMIAAAALNPTGTPSHANAWARARYMTDSIITLPASIHFVGDRIALVGTLGERCCESGHARVFVDGVETFDNTGIWQNKSVTGKIFPKAILFAWQWSAFGPHTLTFYPGTFNPKEGASFLHIQGYLFK